MEGRARPYVMHMTWRDLLFAHWPVAAAALRAHVPPQIEIDEFGGTAWIAVVPFLMTDIRLRGTPPVPGLSRTLELNVRTYVTVDGVPGVYFFSLDAESRPVVHGARALFHLSYFHARMGLRREGDRLNYESRRIHVGALPAEFRGVYWPVSELYVSEPGSLERWLTERYALFTVDRRSRVLRGDIHHERWPLQRAEAEFEHNTMTGQIGLELPGERPLLHYAKVLRVRVWLPQQCR